MPTIQPLFDNSKCLTDYSSSAEIFNNYFASQWIPLEEIDEVIKDSSQFLFC